MGSMLRSDLMSLCEIYIQQEAAYEVMTRLGSMSCVQFLDMNENVSAFHRKFITEVCRCEEMERKLRFMEAEMLKDNIYQPETSADPRPMHPNEMLNYETILEKWEEDIMEMAANQTTIRKSFLELNEMHYVLTHIGPILGDAELYMSTARGGGELEKEGHLVVITGVVMRTRSHHLEMMLWRISRGNIFYRQAKDDKILIDPVSGKEIRKVAFLAICQGTSLSSRMTKICNGFHANIYPCPRTYDERTTMNYKLEVRLQDMEKVIKKTNFHRCKALRTVGRQWRKWMTTVKKTKAIYHHLNLFTLDITKNCLIGRCWVPDQDLPLVQGVLDESSKVVGTLAPSLLSKLKTDEGPPTYHRTNKFTKAFQALINAYGDSTYRELNPGLYTIVTFPFLFAMMFGDIGHGFIMFLFAVWMVRNEVKFSAQRSTNEIWNIFFGGRYVILLMSIFSMFAGMIYNDLFSIKMVTTGSQWFYNMKAKTAEIVSASEYISLDPKFDCDPQPCYFGCDPIWGIAKNKIVVDNSLKMKLSIIIGVVHMLFGLVLSLFNHIYFKKYYAIFFEFLPQIIFLTCLFVYLAFMIYFKWFIFTGLQTEQRFSAGCAPLLLIYFIDMVLMRSTKPVTDGCDAYMYTGQKIVQTSLVLISVLCVPILLFGTPIYVSIQNKKKRKELIARYTGNKGRYEAKINPADIEDPVFQAQMAKYEHGFGELMTHQGVHTIEFVLSTISHTASYLRLWALSLAHAQLSEMLWAMILSKLALQHHDYHGIYRIYIIFPVWAVFTMSIMVLMEGLSAFLHTLRLHWVEFMSKFYMGGGYKFRPFSFGALLEDSDEKPSAFCSKIGKHGKGDE